MPITPLHLGLLAPLNHWLPRRVSNISFLIVTLWLDASAIAYYALGLEMGEFHGPESHSLIAALAISSMVAIAGALWMLWLAALRNQATRAKGQPWPWVVGAFLGGISHILLDAMVHSEMMPFYPEPGNPFYWGGMDVISLALLIPFIWLITQYVSIAADRIRAVLVKRRQKKLEDIA